MNTEDTFVILKPDSIERGLVGEIISRIEHKGYKITNAKMTKLNTVFLYKHYAHLADKPFFPAILEQMMAGPVLGLIIRGEKAISGMRLLAGATKVEEALPGTIRGDFALKTESNLIHCADSLNNAKIEINRFFNTDIFSK